jgi:hypothetical protein
MNYAHDAPGSASVRSLGAHGVRGRKRGVGGDHDAERLGGLEVDDQLEWRGLLDGQVPGFGTL